MWRKALDKYGRVIDVADLEGGKGGGAGNPFFEIHHKSKEAEERGEKEQLYLRNAPQVLQMEVGVLQEMMCRGYIYRSSTGKMVVLNTYTFYMTDMVYIYQAIGMCDLKNDKTAVTLRLISKEKVGGE